MGSTFDETEPKSAGNQSTLNPSQLTQVDLKKDDLNPAIYPEELSAIEDFIAKSLRDCTAPNVIRLRAGLRILMTTDQKTFDLVCSKEVQEELQEIVNLLQHPETLAPKSSSTPEGRKAIIEHIQKFTLDNVHLLNERITILPKASMVEKNIENKERLKSVIHTTAIRNVITAASFVDILENKFRAEGLTGTRLDHAIKTTSEAMERLHSAAIAGDITEFKAHLAIEGIDVNLANPDGLTLLHVATREAHVEIVELLLLMPALKVNRVSSNGWSALHLAARMGHEQIVALLMEAPGIDINLVNSDGFSALHWAAWHGHERIVLLLLSSPQIIVNQRDASEDTALHWAARNGHNEVVTLLLDYNSEKEMYRGHSAIDVNPIDIEGKTPLYYASQFDHVAAVAALIVAPGLDPNIQDMDGFTPLHWAARNGSIAIAELLLTVPGIRKDLVDHNNMTASDWAEYVGHIELMVLLQPKPKFRWLPFSVERFLKKIFKRRKN